jgi:MFS family permease
MRPGYGDDVSVLTEVSHGYVPRMRRPSRERRADERRDGRAFAAVTFTIVALLASSNLPTPLYPTYERIFSLSPLDVTLVYSTYAGTVIVALVLFGRLSDTVGRRRVLLPAVTLAIVAAALFALASSALWLVGAQVVEGIALGMLQGTAVPALLETEPRRDAHRASLVGSSATVAGAAVGPALAGVLAQYAGAPRRLAFVVEIGLLAVGLALLLRRFPKDRGSARWCPQRPRVPASIRRTFVVAGATAFLGWGLASLFLSLVPSYMIELLGETNLALIGGVAAVMLTCSALVQPATARLGPRRAELVGLGLVIAAAGALLAAAELHSLAALVGSGALAGCGLGCAFRGSLADVTAVAPEHERANVVAAFYIVIYVGTSLPVIGVGLLALSTGLLPAVRTFAWVIGAGAAVVLAVVALVERRDTRPHLARTGVAS